MRSSAAFLFQGHHSQRQGDRYSNRTARSDDSHASPHTPSSTGHETNSCRHIGRAGRPSGGLQTRSHTTRIPRPVMIRQLWWPYVGSGSGARTAAVLSPHCVSVDDVDYDDADDAASPATCQATGGVGSVRLGDASILLDGTACSSVTVCGRVLTRCGPEQNGSAAQRHPYSLLLITDHSALVSVIHYHTRTTPLRQPPSSVVPPRPSGSVSRAESPARDVAQACFSDVPWPSATETVSQAAAAHGNRPDGDAEATTAASCKVTRPATHFSDHHFDEWRASVMNSNASCAPQRPPSIPPQEDDDDTAAATNGFFGEGDIIAPEELDIHPGDYVVCVGRLCFADVEQGLAAMLAPIHAPSPVPDLQRLAAMQHATAARPAPHNGDTGDVSNSGVQHTEGRAASFAEATHAWLPHAEEPVLLTDLHALGLTRETLPSRTRFLSLPLNADSEYVQPETERLERTEPLKITAEQSGREVAATAVQNLPLSPFAIKATVSVMIDSNEWLYWALAALHTHLRLTRTSRHPPSPH